MIKSDTGIKKAALQKEEQLYFYTGIRFYHIRDYKRGVTSSLLQDDIKN